MIENRELTIDDYLAILRRRWKVLLVPAMLVPVIAFGISFGFTPKYTSTSVVLVEQQKVPEGYVKPVVTEDIGQRITQLEQRALAAEQLRKIIEKLNLAHGPAVDAVIDRIRKNIELEAVQAAVAPEWGQNRVPGFHITYTASN